jgi:3-oxoacyl-[acyl-carrier protein] reductase
MSDGQAVQRMVEEVAEKHGRLDVLVNNAGITKDGLLMRMSDADWDEVQNVNLRSVFIACRAAARPMLRGKFGRIVNIGSVSGVSGNKGQANYSAAKAGLIGLTLSVAKELGAKGITANVVAPGFVETDMTAFLGLTWAGRRRRSGPGRSRSRRRPNSGSPRPPRCPRGRPGARP